MSMTRILLGVDTEADDQWTAASRKRLTVENVHELPRLQALCDRYGVRPTYLVTYEMAVDDRAKRVLREIASTGRAEIGVRRRAQRRRTRTRGAGVVIFIQ